MCVLSGHRAEHAKGGRDRVAVPLDGQLDDLGRIEVDGVGRERCAGAVLDALVDRKDGEVARAGQATVVEQLLQAPEDPHRAVAVLPDPVDEVAAREVKLLSGNGLAAVLEEVPGVLAQGFFDLLQRPFGDSCHHCLLHIW